MMNHKFAKSTFVQTLGIFAMIASAVCPTANQLVADGEVRTKRESFDRDPNWEGVNHRSAHKHEPITIRQGFGFSPTTAHSGGRSKGEIGGFVSPAGEAAYFAKPLETLDLKRPLKASGTMLVGKGGTHLLLGFFNSKTINEWRTPNTLAIRINGRGDKFFGYVEYCTAKWRAGGDTKPFPSITDPKTGRWNLIGYPCAKPIRWSISYSPNGNNGHGMITATVGDDTAECAMDADHQLDGATFDRFGILNVMKSADSGSEIWIDDVTINDAPIEPFDSDPHWIGFRNRETYPTRLVRPRFDFGFSETHFAGGLAKGELGGQTFRGDCREQARMACYGDRIGPLTLKDPIKASGKIAMTRGVSDSTTLFGFYNSRESMRQNESQSDGVPAAVLGIHIEGPSSEGFKIYPVFRSGSSGSTVGNVREYPTLLPDGKSHDWAFDFDPNANDGNGQITLVFDGIKRVLKLRKGDIDSDISFDRFGIVTSWIDGNSQNVYLDDIEYTVAQATTATRPAKAIDFTPDLGFLKIPNTITLGKCSAASFDSAGRFYLFHRGAKPLLCFDRDGSFLQGWGDELVHMAHGLRIDRHDHIWTTDIGNHLVRKFDRNGKLLLTLGTPGTPGTDTNQFNKPSDIAFGDNDEVFISDGYGNSRVMQFDQFGKFVRTWGKRGSQPGEFNLPHTIKVDKRGRILVGDRENERIQVFDSKGSVLAVWPGFAPYGIEIDQDGNVFVADAAAHRILQLDEQGKIVRTWGGQGSKPGEFNLPHMLAIDQHGNLFVAEVDGKRVQKLVRR